MSCPVYKEDIVKAIKFKLDNKEGPVPGSEIPPSRTIFT
jgi:hypothetical protein